MDRVLLYKIMLWQPPEVNEVHFIASEKSRSLTVCVDHIHLLAQFRKSVLIRTPQSHHQYLWRNYI